MAENIRVGYNVREDDLKGKTNEKLNKSIYIYFIFRNFYGFLLDKTQNRNIM